MKVAGKNVVVYVQEGTEWKLYACATSATLDVTTDIIETSVSGQGKFATYLPTKNSFTGTLEGVTSLEESGKLSLSDLRAKQLAHTILKLRYQRSDGTNLYTEEGSFIITNSTDVGSYDDMNQFTIQAQGTGALSEVASSETPVPFEYRYGWIGIDTVNSGSGYTPLTEQDFMDSLENVFSDGAEYSGDGADLNDNVIIEDFNNTTDKVMFLQVPKTQDVFTMWSEKNNPFQQNQPIDQEYNYGSGSVWFVSEIEEGKWTYITYVQTTFSNEITFSR